MPDASAALPLTLIQARELAARLDWASLAARGDGAAEQLLGEPELAYLVADARRRVGDKPGALALAERVEPAARQRGNARLELRTINVIGIVHFETGRLIDAERRFHQLLELATERGDEEFAARASNNLGMIANIQARRESALACYSRAIAAYQRLGHLRGLAQTHHNLGISYRDLGRTSEADTHFSRAMKFAGDAGSDDVSGLAELERSLLRIDVGDVEFGRTLAEHALQRFERLADPLGRAEALRVLAAASRAAADDDGAACRLDEALGVARQHDDPLLRAEVQRDRGLLLRDRQRFEDSRQALLDAAEQFDRLGATAEADSVRSVLAQLPPSPP